LNLRKEIMQNDELIWQVINQGFCSFKAKLETRNFCRNQYNVTGLCNRSSCPLASSRYATVIEKEGICYLYMKTIERAHTPDKLWEKVKLSKNYLEALQQIDQHLEYWPNFLKHKAKQRLTKIRQYLIRMRKLRKKAIGKKIVTIHKKVEKREKIREDKALKIAQLEKKIKSELLERLKKGVYPQDEIVNMGHEFNAVLEEEGVSDEDEDEEEEEGSQQDLEFVEGSDIEDLEQEFDEDEILEEDEEEQDEESDDEEVSSKKRPIQRIDPQVSKKGKRGDAKINIQFEQEEERGPSRISATHKD